MMTLVYSFVHMFFYSGLGQALLPLQWIFYDLNHKLLIVYEELLLSKEWEAL